MAFNPEGAFKGAMSGARQMGDAFRGPGDAKQAPPMPEAEKGSQPGAGAGAPVNMPIGPTTSVVPPAGVGALVPPVAGGPGQAAAPRTLAGAAPFAQPEQPFGINRPDNSPVGPNIFQPDRY